MSQPHYFSQDAADDDDIYLKMSIRQGYVPRTCLLGGQIVLKEVREAKDPCAGCDGPREKCHGRPKLPAPPESSHNSSRYDGR